jgi:AcrR family transcriptional regulator
LRERKKARTREAISAAAISLFLERGFDQVTVADIAAAAEVSKPTLFSYFATKEALVLHRIADHQDESARVVLGRAAGEGPLAALERHLLEGLASRDPITGLNDQAIAYYRLVMSTPALLVGLTRYAGRDEDSLAAALASVSGATPLTARLTAAQVSATIRVLAHDNWRALDSGESADARYPQAVEAVRIAFGNLRTGVPVALA